MLHYIIIYTENKAWQVFIATPAGVIPSCPLCLAPSYGEGMTLSWTLGYCINLASPGRLCGLVVRVLGYRSRGQGSIPSTTRKKVVGLERGPLSLVSTIEELPKRKSSGSGLENREYGRRDPSRWPRGTLYPQKLAITPLTSGCRLVGIVHSQTQTMEFSFSFRYSNTNDLVYTVMTKTSYRIYRFVTVVY
jgi:hypothetical protein